MQRWSRCVPLFVAAATACGGGEPEVAVGPVVRDSAGVRIVENQVPPTGIGLHGRVAPEPTLRIAGAGQDGVYLGRIAATVTLPSGRIVVANGGSYQIRYYDPSGQLAVASGERARRPGTYQDVTRMGRAGGDTVWVHDLLLGRLTYLDGAGNLLGVADEPTGDFVAGRFGDGSYLLVPGWKRAYHDEDPREGIRRDAAVYRRWWPDTGDTVAVGTFLHNEILYLPPDENGHSYVGGPPFARRTSRAVGPGRFYVGDAESFEIRGFDPDGTLREIIRLEGLDLHLSPGTVRIAREAATPEGEVPEPWEARFWDAVPATRPAYSGLLVDALGNLWVGEHVADLRPPRNWLIFSVDGALRGLVEVPEGLELREVGPDWILGTVEGGVRGDEVVRYALMR